MMFSEISQCYWDVRGRYIFLITEERFERRSDGVWVKERAPVGRLIRATPEVDGELHQVCVGAGQHRQQLQEVQSPNVTVRPAVNLLFQTKLSGRSLQLCGQTDGDYCRSLGRAKRGRGANT